METIAIYWEPVIRVYGFETRSQIALVELHFAPDRLAETGNLLEEIGSEDIGFLFTLLQNTAQHSCLTLVVDAAQVQPLMQTIDVFNSHGNDITVKITQPVDLLYFHGPHFQDRYGIAEKAFKAVSSSTISLHASGCCGTSIYLVVGEGEASIARELLAESFIVPGDKSE